jgi:hypothetical protein
LRSVEFVGANPVGRNLEAILKEGNPPADDNDFPERDVSVFQVAIPRKGHENIGNGKK